jgi:hypothetical protein
MSLQLINLGTPNNNDGDSLYAGGAKINSNFTEIYTQLAGSATNALRIDVGSSGLIDSPVVGDVLGWSSFNTKFIPSSSTMLKTLSGNGSSVLILTNNTGKAGTDEEYLSQPNALDLLLNGRPMWNFVATTTGSTAVTRGTWYIGLGNAQATSLAISTRGVTVGGVDGLTVYRNNAEENGVSSTMLTTGSSGIILHRTPIINSANYVAPSDSSGTIVHSGFVQDAISRRGFANGTSVITAAQALAGGGQLNSDPQIYLNMNYMRNWISGLSYNFRGASKALVVQPGSAAHYSFSTTGAAVINSNDVSAFVAASSEMVRVFDNIAAWASNNTQACLDTIVAGTWYYVFLICEGTTGQPDFVVSDSASHATTQTKLNNATGGSAYDVVRRLGCLRTSFNSIDPMPFVTTAEAGGGLRFSYAHPGIAFNYSSSTAFVGPTTAGSAGSTTSFVVTNITTPVGSAGVRGLISSSTATTASVALFSSVLVRWIPPMPGITADINVVHISTVVTNQVAFFGEPWTSSGALTYTADSPGQTPPTQIIRENIANVTSVHSRILSVSPGNNVISDAQVAGTSVWDSTLGTNLRYVVVNQAAGNNAMQVPTALGFDVRSFIIAR